MDLSSRRRFLAYFASCCRWRGWAFRSPSKLIELGTNPRSPPWHPKEKNHSFAKGNAQSDRVNSIRWDGSIVGQASGNLKKTSERKRRNERRVCVEPIAIATVEDDRRRKWRSNIQERDERKHSVTLTQHQRWQLCLTSGSTRRQRTGPVASSLTKQSDPTRAPNALVIVPPT